MAQKFLTSIDLNLNELQNAKLHVLSTAPTTTSSDTGRMYFNSTNKLPYWYNGSSWVTFATSGDYSTLNNALTTLKDYFTTDGIANQAAKVTNALSFTAGTFSSLSSYDGSTARTLHIPTKTSHLDEETNLFFTEGRVWNTMTGSTTTSLTASRVVVTSSNGKLAASSSITTTELGYLDGVTSSIQTQLNTLSSNFSKYLPLAGGTMTGTIYFGSSSYGITNTGAATLASLSVSGETTLTGVVTTGNNIQPKSNSTARIGVNSLRWHSGYFTTAINVGEANTEPSDGKATKSCSRLGVGSLELSSTGTPYIDFYKTDGSTSKDYTSRIIENTAGILDINGSSFSSGGIAKFTTIKIGNVVLKEDSDGILKIYYNGDYDGTSNTATIYATGGVSALGLGAGSGGTGGGLIQTVYSSSDLSTSSDAFDDADLTSTFNAYTINLIDGKTTELGTQLTGLTSRVASLESYFSTEEDSDTTINKWNELVEFLDGVAETDNLASLLASKVGSVEVTGNGNVFTEASISGSKLTLTKGITFVDDTTLSTWTGSNKITTLGTITTGTWNGTKITNDYINSVAWSKLTSKPTTISGYGITDAYTKTEVDNKFKRYSGTITGNASTTSFTITHSLNTMDVMVFTRDSSTTATNGYQQVYCDIYIKDANNIIVTFASAPASGTTYRVTVLA